MHVTHAQSDVESGKLCGKWQTVMVLKARAPYCSLEVDHLWAYYLGKAVRFLCLDVDRLLGLLLWYLT